jgi:hypothetical protein
MSEEFEGINKVLGQTDGKSALQVLQIIEVTRNDLGYTALVQLPEPRTSPLVDELVEVLEDSRYLVKWLSDNKCECDPDVGMSPCEACSHLDSMNKTLAKARKEMKK